MNVPEERKDICPVCLQPIEPEDEVIQIGERDVHIACRQEEVTSSETTILTKPKSIPAPMKAASGKGAKTAPRAQ
jgi:hypothetical protein